MTADKTLLRMKYADIVRVLAQRTGVSMDEALKRFYESREYRLVSRGISDQHCMTPDYIVDNILCGARASRIGKLDSRRPLPIPVDSTPRPFTTEDTETPVRAARKEADEIIRFAQSGHDTPTLNG